MRTASRNRRTVDGGPREDPHCAAPPPHGPRTGRCRLGVGDGSGPSPQAGEGAGCSRRAGYGLLTVCSASNVNVTADVIPWTSRVRIERKRRRGSTGLRCAAGEDAVARVLTLDVAMPNARRRAWSRRRRRRGGTVEVVAAAVDVLVPGPRDRARRQARSWPSSSSRSGSSSTPVFVTRRSSVTTSPGMMPVTSAPTVASVTMSIEPAVKDQVDVSLIGELSERERAGAQRERGQRRKQRDDSATALAAALDLVLDDRVIHSGNSPDEWRGGTRQPRRADGAGVRSGRGTRAARTGDAVRWHERPIRGWEIRADGTSPGGTLVPSGSVRSASGPSGGEREDLRRRAPWARGSAPCRRRPAARRSGRRARRGRP